MVLVLAWPARPATVTSGTPATSQPIDDGLPKRENVLLGIVGSVLFSLAGGALFFLAATQLGKITGILGFVVFFLANKGYRLFSRTNKEGSIAELVVSILTTVVVLFLAEYISIGYIFFQELQHYFRYDTVMDAIGDIPRLLSRKEFADVPGEMVKDLLFAYGTAALLAFDRIRKIVKASKKSKE